MKPSIDRSLPPLQPIAAYPFLLQEPSLLIRSIILLKRMALINTQTSRLFTRCKLLSGLTSGSSDPWVYTRTPFDEYFTTYLLPHTSGNAKLSVEIAYNIHMKDNATQSKHFTRNAAAAVFVQDWPPTSPTNLSRKLSNPSSPPTSPRCIDQGCPWSGARCQGDDNINTPSQLIWRQPSDRPKRSKHMVRSVEPKPHGHI
jgi:hypothetical protein